MSPVQIVRTVALALIAGGLTLGLVPAGQGGGGWLNLISPGETSYGWFAYEGTQEISAALHRTSMAPMGAWALALIVIGTTLLIGAWFHTSYRPKAQQNQQNQPTQPNQSEKPEQPSQPGHPDHPE